MTTIDREHQRVHRMKRLGHFKKTVCHMHRTMRQFAEILQPELVSRRQFDLALEHIRLADVEIGKIDKRDF